MDVMSLAHLKMALVLCIKFNSFTASRCCCTRQSVSQVFTAYYAYIPFATSVLCTLWGHSHTYKHTCICTQSLPNTLKHTYTHAHVIILSQQEKRPSQSSQELRPFLSEIKENDLAAKWVLYFNVMRGQDSEWIIDGREGGRWGRKENN